MADFILLRRTAEACVLEAFDRCEASRQEGLAQELSASVAIQRQTRRHFAQKLYERKRFVCREVSRIFRGHKSRKVCKELQEAKQRFEEKAIFEFQANAIQHVFRGFYSRRYRHDFYARKAYIANIIEKSNQLRVQLAANRERAAQEEQERKLRVMQEEFKQVAQKLHHLVSTKSRPGVYNSPFALENKPTVFGIPVEEHLRNCTKQVLRDEGLKSSIHKAKRRERKSIQASSHYHAAQEMERQESRRSRTMRISDRDFMAGGKGPMTDYGYVEPLSKGTEFVDQWKIQKSTRDQPLKHSQTPFHTALKKDRLFDDIHDDLFERKTEDPIDNAKSTKKLLVK